MGNSSFFLVVALATFALGVVLYLVSISSTAWQGLSDEFTISLWKECYKVHVNKEWVCESWHVIPGKDAIRLSFNPSLDKKCPVSYIQTTTLIKFVFERVNCVSGKTKCWLQGFSSFPTMFLKAGLFRLFF